jgi:ribosomal protein L12E/L44/L45/RPP1/RPP2
MPESVASKGVSMLRILHSAYKIAYDTQNDEVARANASRLLTNTNIKAEILKFKQVMKEKTGITIEAVVNRIAKLADKADIDADKLKALDMLMKHLGGYVTVVDILQRVDHEQAEEIIQKVLSYINHETDESTIKAS